MMLRIWHSVTLVHYKTSKRYLPKRRDTCDTKNNLPRMQSLLKSDNVDAKLHCPRSYAQWAPVFNHLATLSRIHSSTSE